jgi:hypothetical protein
VSERREVARDGAKAQKNSGRGKIQKGDAIDDNYLVDYKEYGKSFAINRAIWTKICTDAIRSGKELEPVIKLVIGEESNFLRLAVISWSEFERLREIEKGMVE